MKWTIPLSSWNHWNTLKNSKDNHHFIIQVHILSQLEICEVLPAHNISDANIFLFDWFNIVQFKPTSSFT